MTHARDTHVFCTVPGCTHLLMARGYCMTHYCRWRKYGDVQADKPVHRHGAPKPLCTVPGCPNKARSHGYCGAHAKRLRQTGDLQEDKPLRPVVAHTLPLAERLWCRVDQSGGPDACWPWQGRTQKGYGRIRINSHNVFTHRLAYELTYGPLAPEAILDHTCHSVACKLGDCCPHRRCVNPQHLEIVSHLENVRRGRAAIQKIERTHCKHGHPFDDRNTRVNAKGHRRCRTCHRLANKHRVPS